MAKRSPGLELAGHLIPKSIGALGETMDRLYRTHYALCHLPELIGSAFAEHIHPLGVRHKKLFIHVPEDAWRSEIWMFRDEIMNRINRCAGEEIVREIVSTHQRNLDISGTSETENREMAPVENSSPRMELRQVNLTEEELGELRDSCTQVQDEELRKKLFSLYLQRKKLEKLRKKKEWHPCSGCGILCPPEESYCQFCASKERDRIRSQIRNLLTELPWLRYHEVKKHVPCTLEMFQHVRDGMIQRLAAKVRLEDMDSLDAHVLVMLYLHVSPEQLTDEMIRRTLYRLRHDLAKPENFKPYRRYDVIPRGKKAGRKGRVSNVSPSWK